MYDKSESNEYKERNSLLEGEQKKSETNQKKSQSDQNFFVGSLRLNNFVLVNQ